MQQALKGQDSQVDNNSTAPLECPNSTAVHPQLSVEGQFLFCLCFYRVKRKRSGLIEKKSLVVTKFTQIFHSKFTFKTLCQVTENYQQGKIPILDPTEQVQQLLLKVHMKYAKRNCFLKWSNLFKSDNRLDNLGLFYFLI